MTSSAEKDVVFLYGKKGIKCFDMVRKKFNITLKHVYQLSMSKLLTQYVEKELKFLEKGVLKIILSGFREYIDYIYTQGGDDNYYIQTEKEILDNIRRENKEHGITSSPEKTGILPKTITSTLEEFRQEAKRIAMNSKIWTYEAVLYHKYYDLFGKSISGEQAVEGMQTYYTSVKNKKMTRKKIIELVKKYGPFKANTLAELHNKLQLGTIYLKSLKSKKADEDKEKK